MQNWSPSILPIQYGSANCITYAFQLGKQIFPLAIFLVIDVSSVLIPLLSFPSRQLQKVFAIAFLTLQVSNKFANLQID